MWRDSTFFLYRAENGIGDESAEEPLKNPKTSLVSYINLEVAIFAKTFEFYLMTQSVKKFINFEFDIYTMAEF